MRKERCGCREFNFFKLTKADDIAEWNSIKAIADSNLKGDLQYGFYSLKKVEKYDYESNNN